MGQLVKIVVILIALGVGVNARGAGHLTDEEKARVVQLREEISKSDAEIAAAELRDQEFSGGLIKSLIAVRLEILLTNRSLIEQRIHAIESGADLTMGVPAQQPDLELSRQLALEIEESQVELEAAQRDADRYSGGLIRATKLSTVAVQEQTIAMLRQRYLSAKYGLALPETGQTEGQHRSTRDERVAEGNKGEVSAPDIPPRDGPFGLDIGLSKADVERMIGQNLVAVEGAPSLFQAPTVPRPHAAFEVYALLIAPSSGLCQIRAVGKDIRTSSHGLQLRSSFEDLVSALSESYGKVTKLDRLLPGSIWDEPEDWMMSLVKKERFLQAEWPGKAGSALGRDLQSVDLVARAKRRDTGYLFLQYSFTNDSSCEEEIKRAEKGVL